MAVLSYPVGWYHKVDKVFLEGHSHNMKGNGDNDQQQKIWLETSKNPRYHENGQTLEKVVQKGCRFSILGNVQNSSAQVLSTPN